jgi:GNAT superfamily N-acetyltransferase
MRNDMTSEEATVRRAVAEDAEAIIAVAETSGLFGPEEMEAFAPMIRDGVAGGALWLVAGPDVQGAAFAEPEAFAEGVWNLRFIAVRPEVLRGGHGAALLAGAERMVRAAGGRMLLVDTGSGGAFDAARRFYLARGYDLEARIRDYWSAGEDKVTFRKAM